MIQQFSKMELLKLFDDRGDKEVTNEFTQLHVIAILISMETGKFTK